MLIVMQNLKKATKRSISITHHASLRLPRARLFNLSEMTLAFSNVDRVKKGGTDI